MSSRPTARCCRAARRLRAPIDSIWITDSVLANAFERYCHVSRLSRRNSSSVPGPLENRRRLGKRRMTGLYSADFQPTLPPWLIEYPVDLSQWKWMPPTPTPTPTPANPDAATREAGSSQRRRRSLLSWVEKWLPVETEQGGVERVELTTDPPQSILQPKEDLEERLRHARDALSPAADVLAPEFRQVMDGIRRDIHLGLVSLDSVHEALATFPTSPSASTTQANLVVTLAKRRFLSAVIDGLVYSRVQNLAQTGPELGRLLLKSISELPTDQESAQMAQHVLAATPEEQLGTLSEGLHALVRTWLPASPECYSQAAAILADGLGRLSPTTHGELLHSLETVALEAEPNTDITRRLRWLDMLARMRQVNESFFLEACVRSGCFDEEPSSTTECRLVELLIRQWQSRGYFPGARMVRDACRRDALRDADLGLASLAWNISLRQPPGKDKDKDKDNRNNNNSLGLLTSYFKVLRRLDLSERFLQSFQKLCTQNPTTTLQEERGFKLLAIASRDHRIAAAVYGLMKHQETNNNTQRRLSTWDWKAWTPYIQSMILDAHIPPRTVWEVVHTRSPQDLARSPTSHLRLAAKRRLVADMAVWFSQAAHLSDRAALRHVSRCNAWLAANGTNGTNGNGTNGNGNGEVLPPQALLAVVRAATRDVKRGERGRTQRMNWVLDLVRAHLGDEQAMKTGKVLERWRRNNAQMPR
ncbi:hypothetical protein SODALDRAFT_209960 [Sodiomyces alkalinus F11]|uniref:Uncharacterized protein n=1 Tax=Sodiomyces alkalinus (strain CBS 110278 / VKM F-3762 / F11) TaxID=1314773 RepID=A0A3N2PQW0_SODAK|nr:hypothetical protein SODALDRAFT_209960 [Sodiomyces alkalinus F11]ROT36903.1 hypothetical protein SODALDRAFT_209960 [Sodiomyces alkalinus F11]